MSRALLRETFTDDHGNRQAGLTVHVYEPGTTTHIASAMHSALTGGTVLANPLTSDANGEINAYLDAEQMVTLFIPATAHTLARTVPAVAVGVGGGAGSLTADEQDALDGANSPSAANVFATIADVGGASLPEWWTVDSTPGSESVTFGGRVRLSPTDQTDANGEGLMVFETTDDLVNESNYAAIVAALVKPSAQVGSLIQDYIFMLTVQGLFINAPVEEGGSEIQLHARGLAAYTSFRNSGFEILGVNGMGHTISSGGIGFFGPDTGATPVTQQTLGANPTGAEIRAVLAAYGLVAA